ncbi:MAG TPA: glycosyltransferase family 4 protein [Candidatus Elarobacter sp.]
MKILVAAEHLGRAGGMERYLETVLPALQARGAELLVVARRLDATPSGITAEALAWSAEHEAPDASARAGLERISASFAPDAAIAVNVMDAGIVEALRAAPRLMYQLHDHRPLCPNGDRVFPRSRSNCTAPLGAACVLHALTDGCAYGPRPRTLTLIAQRRRLRDAIAAADTVVVNSAYVADRAASCGIAGERIVEIAPPLPDDAFAGSIAPAASPASVVFAGRLVPQKGLLTLIDAIARLPASRRPLLRAFGDGPQRAAARERAERRGVAIELPGAVAAEDLRVAIDRAALVAVPSVWAEPFGLVGIEACARGRPVVAFAAGGIEAWLRDGENGRAVTLERGDEARSAALSGALAELLGDEALRARLGAGARALAERYRAAPIVDALLRELTP